MMSRNNENKQRIDFFVFKKAISKKLWFITSILFLINGLMAWTSQIFANSEDWWLHGIWCVNGLLIAFPIIKKTLDNGVTSAIVDHKVMLLAAFTLYFTLGASLFVFGSDSSISQAMGRYPISAIDALRVDGFNSIGLAIALATGAALKGEWFLGGARGFARFVSKTPAHLVLLILLILGMSGYLLLMARDLGLVYMVVPGALGQMAMLLLFCIFLGAAYKGKMSFAIHSFSLLTLFIMVVLGLLTFNKTSIYLPILAFAAGIAIRKGSIRYLLLGVLAVFFSITLLGDMVSYGRENGGLKDKTLSERISIVQDYMDSPSAFESQYSGWSRLNYMSVQAASIDFYDQGDGGNGFSLVPWLFVPRLLNSNKPIITAGASELNYKIYGVYTSSVAMGVFISGYYNGGWLGFFFASIFCGWFLAQTSSLTAMLIEEKAYLLLPLGLLGVYIAFRIDGDLIFDHIGTFVIISFPLVAFIFMFGISKRMISK